MHARVGRDERVDGRPGFVALANRKCENMPMRVISFIFS